MRFVSHKNHDEGWTPVVKSNGRKRLPNKGEGTVINPVRCSDTEKVRLAGKKEIKYTELDGTPGLTFRDGKTRHSYKWMPIAPDSPISSRTRVKLKPSSIV